MFDPPFVFEERKEDNLPSQKRKLKERLLDLWQLVSATVVGLAILVFLSILPLLFNFSTVKWYAKIFMIFGTMYAFVILVMFFVIFANAKESKRSFLYFSPLFIVHLTGIVAYFDFGLWGQKNLIFSCLFIFVLFLGFFAGVNGLLYKSFDGEETPSALIAILILTLFIALVNEKANNAIPANLCYKISGGLIYWISSVLYINRYLYKSKKTQKNIKNISGIIIKGALIALSFPFYIRWWGLAGECFNAFVSVYAAVLGGGITLAGVAWTIKDTNEKRQQDLMRIESERKEEERKKHIPYVRASFNKGKFPPVVVNANITKGLDLEKEEDIALFKDNAYFSINIKDFDIKNISNENIIIIGVSIRGKFYKFSTAEILEPNECCRVLTTNSRWIIVDELDDKFSLYVADVVGNTYKMECRVSHKSEDLQYQFKIINEETYRWHRCSYIVTSVGLPKFIPR